MYSPLVERRVEFLRDRKKCESNLRREISSVLQFFDDRGADIERCCCVETQHRIFEAQEKARFSVSAKFVAQLKKLRDETQDEIEQKSFQPPQFEEHMKKVQKSIIEDQAP